MALPLINDKPKYEMVIPSTKKKIRYRPFLVKEQKILLLAYESKDKRGIIRAILDTLNACIEEDINVYKLSTFDVDYMFSQIRAKSVGETLEVNITSPDDGHTQVKVEIDIDSIKVQKNPKDSNIIQLDDNLSVEMKYPSLNQFVESNFETNMNQSDVDKSLDVIISCIGQVFTEDESWSASDCTKKELREFVEQMNTKQFKDIEVFFETMPKLTHTIEVTNPNTNVKNSVLLEGLASFFS